MQQEQLDINDLHNEYCQQIAMLSQRCALLSVNVAMLRRVNQQLLERQAKNDQVSSVVPDPVAG